MAWVDVPQDTNWEYATSPNADKKPIDTYDYDMFTDHVAGIRGDANHVWYVLCRQKNNPNPGYGELYFYVP
jgi:hypothetical protein